MKTSWRLERREGGMGKSTRDCRLRGSILCFFCLPSVADMRINFKEGKERRYGPIWIKTRIIVNISCGRAIVTEIHFVCQERRLEKKTRISAECEKKVLRASILLPPIRNRVPVPLSVSESVIILSKTEFASFFPPIKSFANMGWWEYENEDKIRCCWRK